MKFADTIHVSNKQSLLKFQYLEEFIKSEAVSLLKPRASLRDLATLSGARSWSLRFSRRSYM
jgi:hypothetical protein